MVKRLRQRLSEIDPFWLDAAMAVGLTLLVFAQLYFVNIVRSSSLIAPGAPVPGARFEPHQPGWLNYLLVAAAFLPLAFRRKAPWPVFTVSVTAAVAYAIATPAPAPTILAPMIAIYTVALHSRPRRSGLVALLVAGLVTAAGLFVFVPTVRWVSEVVGPIVLLTATALLGQSERNRREYVEEYERRALEAERTREEEALRRVDEERIRIAREVHDIVAHSLSIVTVQASAAAALLENSPQAARESIENVRQTGKQALTELRSMLDVLRTPDAESPLEPAAHISTIEDLVERVRDAGIEVDLQTQGDLGRVPAYASVSAYRVVQEALTNIVRHSGARHVEIGLSVTSRELTVRVADDGGDGPAPRRIMEGHGIRGMRERVDALGGTFEIGPAEKGGILLQATIPLTRGSS
jgi:signal transduction histidine kinase